MMGMYFHFTVEESAILFYGWKTTNANEIIGSVIGIIILGAIYEGLKSYREHLFIKMTMINQRKGGKISRKNAIFSGMHLLQTFLHTVQLIMGYFLMFIFMTFNIWLALGVVIGTGLGYWLFAWDKYTNENTDCC
ncbi:hypothetical protein PV325_013734 [Microctonus aethiopoides]|uniref:Copper transport protein n=1 Tax=Microctonus aethiopoides TaxID=144406 RepID=A0AA39EZP4_9HYME|nr:hypothetical protein PV325_013734 [Microctonus aethiopoides]KAK0160184.1 hypothetical protein PV328_007612 [Microctonus aethiopoides]